MPCHSQNVTVKKEEKKKEERTSYCVLLYLYVPKKRRCLFWIIEYSDLFFKKISKVVYYELVASTKLNAVRVIILTKIFNYL